MYPKLLVAIPFKMKPKGNIERMTSGNEKIIEHTKVCEGEVFLPLISEVWLTGEAVMVFHLSLMLTLRAPQLVIPVSDH